MSNCPNCGAPPYSDGFKLAVCEHGMMCDYAAGLQKERDKYKAEYENHRDARYGANKARDNWRKSSDEYRDRMLEALDDRDNLFAIVGKQELTIRELRDRATMFAQRLNSMREERDKADAIAITEQNLAYEAEQQVLDIETVLDVAREWAQTSSPTKLSELRDALDGV